MVQGVTAIPKKRGVIGLNHVSGHNRHNLKKRGVKGLSHVSGCHCHNLKNQCVKWLNLQVKTLKPKLKGCQRVYRKTHTKQHAISTQHSYSTLPRCICNTAKKLR
jgi:hypothetical protein